MRRLITLSFIIGLLSITLNGYVLKGPKWPGNPSYYVNPTNLDLPSADFLSITQQSFNDWANQSGDSRIPLYAGATTDTAAVYNSKNIVVSHNAQNGSSAATTYCWSTGGTTMLDCDIVVWDYWKWFTDLQLCVNGLYLHDTLIHEVGHFLGLGHSTIPTATMYSTTTKCNSTLRTLDPDDIAGILYLYPAVAPPVPPPPPTTDGGGGTGGHRGHVKTKQGVITTNSFGDQLYESDITMEMEHGVDKSFRVVGGTVAGVTMSSSDFPDIEVDDTIEVLIQNGRAKMVKILSKHNP